MPINYLGGFKVALDWLCVVGNRKWVAMMTQRLFRRVFFFLFMYFSLSLFLLNHVALTHRSAPGRCVVEDRSDSYLL